MCGIFGVASARSIDQNAVKTSTALLRHRGPDSLQYHFSPEAALGFARLSIIDTRSIANQPMLSNNGKVAIVFNGEIYNFKRLRETLERVGAVFRTNSDTEVILESYLRFGFDATIKTLEGMFGIALVDAKEKRLFLARDRFGMKPLYYHHNQSQLVFASEIKSILNYTGHRAFEEWSCFNPLLMTGLAPPGTTMFKGVEELLPGEILSLDLRSYISQKKSFFDLAEWVSHEEYARLDAMPEYEVQREFSLALRASTEDHLQSDVPLGILFSAGLDSSAVAAVARSITQSSPTLFKFTSDAMDDRKYLVDFQNKFQCPAHEVQKVDDDLIFDLPKLIFHYETINKEEGAALGRACNLARQKGFKVLLTGDAADEVFCGYGLFSEFFLQAKFLNNPILRKLLSAIESILPGLTNIGAYRGNLSPQFSPTIPGLLEIPLDLLLHRGGRSQRWKQCLNVYHFIDSVDEQRMQAFLLDDISYRLHRFLLRADRFGMMESVELRLPFLDHRIVKLALNTPLRHKLRFRPRLRNTPRRIALFDEKSILRSVAGEYGVPKSILRRTKLGTPLKQRKNVQRLLEKWPLTFTPQLFRISEKEMRSTLNAATDHDGMMRLEWSLLAAEILCALFIECKSVEQITEDLRAFLSAES